MLPDTAQRIDKAIMETQPFTLSPRTELVELATGALHRARYAQSPEETRAHILRAVAYLVRRLELDAAGPG